MKLIVIGLDGAGFELIDPWLSEGKLPNLARIKGEGVWADMKSVLPPVTAPNWKCYSTGKNPGKLGIFWWENVDWKDRRVYYPAARIGKQKEIWDYIGEAGMKVGVLGTPTTYPPKKVNGFLVAGGVDAEDKNFAYPRELEAELRRRGWRNRATAIIDIDKDKAVQELTEIIGGQFRIANSLAKTYALDFLQITCFHVNILHHFLWDAPETKKAWEIIDRRIGELMDWGCDLMIMSDHGANKIKHVFNINSWLQKEGYLKLHLGTASALTNFGVNRQRLMVFLSRLGILELARRIVPMSLQRQVPDASGGIPRETKTGKVNWEKSEAVASGQGPIYLNPGNSEHAERLKEQIRQKLVGLTEPITGDRIAKRVYTKEEIYHGQYLAEAPDIVIDQAKGVHIPGSIGQKETFDFPQRWQAENKSTGLFMAYGPSVKRGRRVENISILDLAPTILHMMNVAIPDDMDGRVLREIFTPGSAAAEREIVDRRGQVKAATGERERIKQAIGRLPQHPEG